MHAFITAEDNIAISVTFTAALWLDLVQRTRRQRVRNDKPYIQHRYSVHKALYTNFYHTTRLQADWSVALSRKTELDTNNIDKKLSYCRGTASRVCHLNLVDCCTTVQKVIF